MKSKFVIISMLLTMLFFIWTLISSPDQLTFATNPFIYVDGSSKDVVSDKATVEKTLQQLATDTDSIVVKRLVDPESPEQRFVYKQYGTGSLPKPFVVAPKGLIQGSEVFGQYLILNGELSSSESVNVFEELGYRAKPYEGDSTLTLVAVFFSSGALFFAIIIFMLTFAALTIVSKIKALRFAGIRLISGESLLSIIGKELVEEAMVIFGSSGTMILVGMGILACFDLFQSRLVLILFTALMLYSCLLFFISIILSLVYVVSLRSNDLMPIIKGKLPLKRLLAIILFGQLVAIVMVGFGGYQIPQLQGLLKEQQAAAMDWRQQTKRVNVALGLNQAHGSMADFIAEAKTWYPFITKAIEEEDALLVGHNLTEYMIGPTNMAGNTIDDYVPLGNTLYVTPNYFSLVGTPLDDAILDQLNRLEEGEFGLLLPEKLKAETANFKEVYEEHFNVLIDSHQIDPNFTQDYQASAVINYLPNNQDRFLFNNKIISQRQYLTDPIIVVLTPKSLGQGEAAQLFWLSSLDHQLFFADYDQTLDLLKKESVYTFVSELENSQQLYEIEGSRLRNELLGLLAGAVLGILTSLLLFYSMNLLYFEEFRREIFIKRLAGMKFLVIHQNYLTVQFVVLLVGVVGIFLLTNDLLTSSVAFLLFIGNGVGLLYRQMMIEDKLSVTVMKGK
jgi:putative ABC transport system permease protein